MTRPSWITATVLLAALAVGCGSTQTPQAGAGCSRELRTCQQLASQRQQEVDQCRQTHPQIEARVRQQVAGCLASTRAVATTALHQVCEECDGCPSCDALPNFSNCNTGIGQVEQPPMTTGSSQTIEQQTPVQIGLHAGGTRRLRACIEEALAAAILAPDPAEAETASLAAVSELASCRHPNRQQQAQGRWVDEEQGLVVLQLMVQTEDGDRLDQAAGTARFSTASSGTD